MRVVVTTEMRFTRTPDGTVWANGGPGRSFWDRYLAVFEQVRIVARVADRPRPAAGSLRVDGGPVEVWPVPHYVGPRQYLLRRAAVSASVRAAAADVDAVLLRVPSQVGVALADSRERRRLPYGLEVVGDPYDVFAPGVVRHPLRPLLRWWLSRELRRRCRCADAVAYVTARALQARYPAAPQAVTGSYSSVELPEAAFAPRGRGVDRTSRAETVISVGSLEQMYKGVDTVLAALARLAAQGSCLRFVHIGDGRYRSRLEALAGRLGLADRVTFTGFLTSGEEIRRQLDEADLFVLPSRAEGLPRALVEAMARGLPAVGSTVGGIPELLPADLLVPPDDAAALAATIAALIGDPARMARESASNLVRAREFSIESLDRRRTAFYRLLREITEQQRRRA